MRILNKEWKASATIVNAVELRRGVELDDRVDCNENAEKPDDVKVQHHVLVVETKKTERI